MSSSFSGSKKSSLSMKSCMDEFEEAIRDFDNESNDSMETQPKKKTPKQPDQKTNHESEKEKMKSKNSKGKKNVRSDISDSELSTPKKKSKNTKKTTSDIESNSKSKSKKNEPKPSTSSVKQEKKVETTEEKFKPVKAKKINIKQNIVVDPSSTVKTSEHKYPFEYQGTTYYCKYLPENFQEQWDGICKMRKAKDAPYDTLGAGKLADPNEDAATQRFQTLVAIILSSMTPDERLAEAVTNLKNYGLTIKKMIEVDPSYLLTMIRIVTFNSGKVNYIKQTAQILHDQYHDDVPRTRAEIQALPGCGPKVANHAMWCCWNEITGIAIDTHMERILGKRLKWSSHTKREKQMKEIETWMPRVMWPDLNDKLVGFGQTYCDTKKPKCSECRINETCDYYITQF